MYLCRLAQTRAKWNIKSTMDITQLIGIRHEDKYLMERRVPIIPSHVEALSREGDLGFAVQSSEKRVFTDSEYRAVGAEVVEKLSRCPVIFGVKEIPESFFEKGKTYVFFSHVIKGQAYNMPMLKKMMDLGCNLIDYECITDAQDRRLIFFGRFAGLAGMINSLWSMGRRLQSLGMKNNPFLRIRQSCEYDSLEEAKKDVSAAGMEIAEKGLPGELLPLVIGFTGYGNVSRGAQEIAALLPGVEITPEQLLKDQDQFRKAPNLIYRVVFEEKHLSRHKDGQKGAFDLQDYYRHPEAYENDFEQYIPHLSILMNCMYWDQRYPRIFTKSFARKLFANGRPKLTVVGDVTCDPDGSIEFTHRGTPIEDPVFVYDPLRDQPTTGFDGEGILVMAVDILPSELPRDASVAFSDALHPFVRPIALADYSQPFERLALPDPVKKALILHQGKLTPDYIYIEKCL